MAILKRHKKQVIHDHVENDIGVYVNVKAWLSKIHKVIDIDSNKEWKVDAECKLIYGYLFGFGNTQGWENIYPNQVDIQSYLGISESSVKRKLKVLGECGLIDIIKTKDKSQFTSNRYRVKQARHVARRKWFDINGVQLVGKMYRFDISVFKNKG